MARKRPVRQTIRTLIPVIIVLIAAVGFGLHAGFGTLSDFGWRDISLLCPLGALTTMLASKMFVPRALISLVIAIVLIVLLGRAFCGWICPVPLVSRLRGIFKPKASSANAAKDGKARKGERAANAESSGNTGNAADTTEPCGKQTTFDSRHVVLAGSLLSAAVFGFPVFCLICPIGLTFATVFLLMRAFGAGDVTIALIVVPAVLILEVVFLRSWCHKFCPLGALMSLVGKLNRTARPAVDKSTCLVSAHGASCGTCAKVCPERIDPREPANGERALNECTRCMACVDACPAKSIHIRLVDKPDGE